MNSSSFLRSPATQWKRPVRKLSAPEIHVLRLVPGVRRGLCLPLSPLAHPAEAHSGVGLQLGLVLEEGARRRLLLHHRQHVFEPLPLFFLVFLGAPLGRDGARPPPAEAEAVEHAANRLPARRGGSLPEQLQGEELATPARAQPAMVGGRALFEQTLDTLVRLLPEQRFRASPSLLVEGRTPPLPEEAASDRIHGSTRAEEDAGDLGGRETVGGEQRDVHPQPSTGFHFALHFDDEILAFFGSDGDILHRRPSLWWLDGFGVFTMPQRTVACSIILCIYLDSNLTYCTFQRKLNYRIKFMQIDTNFAQQWTSEYGLTVLTSGEGGLFFSTMWIVRGSGFR